MTSFLFLSTPIPMAKATTPLSVAKSFLKNFAALEAACGVDKKALCALLDLSPRTRASWNKSTPSIETISKVRQNALDSAAKLDKVCVALTAFLGA